jgi:hypothetical protein
VTSVKSLYTEQRLATLVNEGWAIAYEAIKPAVEGRTSTTLADDSDLKFTNVAPGDYQVELDIIYSGGAGTSESDLKFDFGLPGSGSLATLNLQGIIRLASDAGNLHQGIFGDGSGSTAYTNGLTTFYGMSLSGQLNVQSSGSVSFQWAAGTNSGTQTRVQPFSRFSLSRRD